MRVVVIFSLLLFSFLVGSHDTVYAGVGHGNTYYSQAQLSEKAQRQKPGKLEQKRIIKKNTILNEDEEFFGIENENDGPVFSRKYVLLAESSVIVVYASILFCFYHYQKKRLPFCKHLSYTASYKYILQRTLRI